MKYILNLFLSILIFFIFITSCSYKPIERAVIKIKGSDTMLELTKKLAGQYMKNNPGISIYVSGGGSAEGIRALIRGETDICTASRNIRPEEAKALADYYGSLGLIFLVAKDALSIYLNKRNPVKNLTLQQLKLIYECKITNWKDVGGFDKPIIPVIRNTNSGTYLYFKEHVLTGDAYCENSVIKPTTRSIIEYVSENINAIGYGGIGYKGDIYYANINGITPSEENARNDSYPITRYLHFFTTKTPTGSIKRFIDWVLSPDGQNIVKQSGFIPLWEVSY